MHKSMVTMVSTFSTMGLIFNMEYIFEVQSINNYGTGPPASVTVRTSALQGEIIADDIANYYDFTFFRNCDCL